MNALLRSASALIVLSSIALVSCSGGVSVPAAGTGPTAPAATPTAVATGTVTATPTPSGSTAAPTSTPTVAPTSAPSTSATATATPTSAPAGTATPTGAPTTAGACPPSFPPEPASSTAPWPSAGGTIQIPQFADLSGTVVVPSNSASTGTTLTFQLDQNTFTDEAGNGNIPTPPSGYTAIVYVAAYLKPAQTITFGGTEKINVTATAPCELPTGKTYVAFAYANGGGFNHSELSPTTGYPATQAANGSVSFTIDLSASGGLQPTGTLLETVFASKP